MSEGVSPDPDLRDMSAADRPTSIHEEYVLVDNQFARIDGVLRRVGSRQSPTVVIQTHPRRTSVMNLSAWPTRGLATMGFDTFGYNNRATNSAAGTEVITVWEDLALDVAAAVQEMRSRGYEQVVLYGHSAGGPLVSYYQNVAESGNGLFEASMPLSGFSGYRGNLTLPPADAIVLQNSTTGTGYSFLQRLDGSVVDEGRGTRDPQLNPFLRENGFDPDSGEGYYTDEFRRAYYAAQAWRMNRLVESAQERLERVRGGNGTFSDDELMIIRGIRGELSCVDLRLSSTTTGAFQHFPAGRSDVIRSDRRVIPHYAERNSRFRDGGTVHTLKSFLSYRAVVTNPAEYQPDAVWPEASGVDMKSSFSSTAENLSKLSVPLLITASTADTEVHLPSAELLFNSAGTSEKSLAFISGAEHDMTPAYDGNGDTRAVHLEVVSGWLSERLPS